MAHHRSEYQRKYRAENIEKVRAERSSYYFAHKEKIAGQCKAWRIANPEKSRAATRRWRERNPDYDHKSVVAKRLETIAGRPRPAGCETCGENVKLCFDHDHNSGEFRGWLCSKCNTALGMTKDSPAILRALAAYLEQKND